MRVYNVQFAHIRHGSNWLQERVVVRGFVEDAVAKAKRELAKSGPVRNLRAEEVTLISECK